MKTRLLFLTLLFVSILNLHLTAQTENLTQEDKTNIVETISKLLNDNYVFPDVAVKVGEHLKTKLDAGAFDTIKDAKEFSEILTKEAQSISHDKHMRIVQPRRGPVAAGENINPIYSVYRRKAATKIRNYGFAKLEKLEDNVGYMEITEFPPLAEAKKFADLAMKFLASSDALIIDLRRNGGGNPDLIQYICSYLFEKPTHINSIYNRLENRTKDFITFEKVDGKKMSDVPLFVLTSDYTFSGGEEFAYNIQTQKRGLLIGETTKGGANPGGLFPVTNDLGIFIPTGRAINPITKTNWEGVGVVPEIKVDSEKALIVALPKAREAALAHKKAQDEKINKIIEDVYGSLQDAIKLYSEGNNDKADELIESTIAKGLKNEIIDEAAINQFGYTMLSAGNYELALTLFKCNVKTYPESSNAYDSLGEAYMNVGDNANAVKNYKKSLELNPANKNAEDQIKKLSK